MRATSPTDPSIRTRYWSISAESLIELLHSNLNGLTDDQASQRLAEFGANRLQTKRRAGPWRLLFSQFKSPIILILIGAAILSLFLQDTTDALIILAIVIASGLLGFWQEHSAANAVSKLRSIVEVNARVLRDGVEKVVLSKTWFPAM
jgi:Mg2+-importing ATPase